MSQEKTLVVILCMHRCGSSLTARLLQRLGMSLGPFDLGEANESNKYGHFEAQPFVLLNREFQLRQFGFEGDLPDDAETLRRYCQCDGRWTSAAIPTADRDPRPAARVPRCPGARVPDGARGFRRPRVRGARDSRGSHRPRPRPRRPADGVGHRLRLQGSAAPCKYGLTGSVCSQACPNCGSFPFFWSAARMRSP